MAQLAAFGWMLFTSGRIEEAFEAVEQAVELAAGDPSVSAGMFIGNPYAFALMQGAQWGLSLGQLTVQEAFARIEKADAVAREQGDAELVAWVSEAWVRIARMAGPNREAVARAERAVQVADRIGDSFSRGMAHGTLGRAHLDNGDCEGAIPELSQAVEMWRAARTSLNAEVNFLAPLAEAHLCTGNAKRGLEIASEAVSLARERGARFQEIAAQVALARAVVAVSGGSAVDEAETAVRRAEALVDELGVRGIEVFEERARLAELTGDRAARERALREAHRRLTEVGAGTRAARIAKQLDELASAATASVVVARPDES